MILSAAKTDEAKKFYLLLAAKYHYSSRELERQLDSVLFERTMLSDQHTSAFVERYPCATGPVRLTRFVFVLLLSACARRQAVGIRRLSLVEVVEKDRHKQQSGNDKPMMGCWT